MTGQELIDMIQEEDLENHEIVIRVVPDQEVFQKIVKWTGNPGAVLVPSEMNTKLWERSKHEDPIHETREDAISAGILEV